MNMQDYNRVFARVEMRAACRGEILRDGAAVRQQRIPERSMYDDLMPRFVGIFACVVLLICGGILYSGLREHGQKPPESSAAETTTADMTVQTDTTTTAQTETTTRTGMQTEETTSLSLPVTTLTPAGTDGTDPAASESSETTAAVTAAPQTDAPVNTETTLATEMRRYSVEVVTHNTYQPIPDVTVRLEKRFYTEQGYGVVYTGETEPLETWITSEDSPHIVTYPFTPDKPFYIFAVIDRVPEGYSYFGAESAEIPMFGVPANEPFWYYETRQIRLTKEKYYYYENFPIMGSYTRKICISANGETPEGVECAVIDNRTGETVYRWNTSEEPVAAVPNLQYRFDDWHMQDAFSYTLRILNKTDQYYLSYIDLETETLVEGDSFPLVGFTAEEYEAAVAKELTIYLHPMNEKEESS